MAEWMDQLERLAELRDKGLLSDEEFEVKRQEIVNISSRIIKEEMKTSEVINPNGDNHDYGVHDYDVLFPNGEYRDDYDLLELQAMSVEDLDELSDWLKRAGYPRAVSDPHNIHKYLKELEKRKEQIEIATYPSSEKLASEKVVVSAPMSFAGSAQRIWKITDREDQVAKLILSVVALLLIGIAWGYVLAWYLVFGIFLIPYRLIRRGNRKDKVRALQHKEQLDAIKALDNT